MSRTRLSKISMTPQGAWDSTTEYKRLDVVSNAGASWLAKQDNVGVTPVEGEDWMLLTDENAVSDVKVNGSSVVTDRVATIPVYNKLYDGTKVGLYPLAPNSTSGVTLSSGVLSLFPAFETYIQKRTGNLALTPTNYDIAVKHAMTDGVGAAWTEDEKKAARERLGIVTCTQEEYDLIAEPSESTIYVIVG